RPRGGLGTRAGAARRDNRALPRAHLPLPDPGRRRVLHHRHPRRGALGQRRRHRGAGAGANGARDRVPGGARGAHRAGRSAALRVMNSAYEWLIGTRYLRSTHRRGFVSFVALMSVLGLMLGVATLITVLSVMNGFERELRSRILSVTSHGTLSGIEGSITDWQAIQRAALKQPGVQAAVPYIEEQAMLSNGVNVAGATVRGVLPNEERKATGLAQRLKTGRLEDLEPGQYHIVLGSALARELHAKV